MTATQNQVLNPRLATMESILANFPEELILTPQWVLYKQVNRDGRLTKVPYQPNGLKAESTNPPEGHPNCSTCGQSNCSTEAMVN